MRNLLALVSSNLETVYFFYQILSNIIRLVQGRQAWMLPNRVITGHTNHTPR